MMFSIVQLRARTPERVQTSGIFRTNEPPSGNHPSPITTCQLWFRVHCSYILSPNISLVGVSLHINCSAHSTLKIYVFQLFISSCNNYISYVARHPPSCWGSAPEPSYWRCNVVSRHVNVPPWYYISWCITFIDEEPPLPLLGLRSSIHNKKSPALAI